MGWVDAVAPVVLWVLPHTVRPPCAPTFPPLPAPACFSVLWLLSLLLLVAPLQDGATPLYVAAQNGHTEVVAALVAAGASLNQAMKVRGMVVR